MVSGTFRERVLGREVLVGTFLGLGSPLTAEIVALSGLDWVVIDLEHGHGTEREALGQLLAVARAGIDALVRIESNDRPRFHRALDMGASGVLVPRLEGVENARNAVACARYSGLRGVARGNRAWQWGLATDDYLVSADEQTVCAMQIETGSAYREAREIAEVNGVDILFLGPADLANALGIRGRPDHPDVLRAAGAVAAAAAAAGKAAGAVTETLDQAATYRELGYTLLACSSDTAMIAGEARRIASGLSALR